MQSVSALRRELKPFFFIIVFFFQCHVVDTFFRLAALSGWLEYLESQLDPRHESCTCQGRLVFDLHCAFRRSRLCQVIILSFCLRRYLNAVWNNSKHICGDNNLQQFRWRDTGNIQAMSLPLS